MKIKNLAIIILMTIFFIIMGTKAYATIGIINENTVKLRKQPDSKTVLDYIYKGDKVEILELESGWYKVKATTELGKVTGYISEKEVDVEEQKANTNVEIPDEAPVVVQQETPAEIQTEKQEETITVETTEIENEEIEENKQYTLNQEVSVKALPLINSREKAKIKGNIKIIEIINNWSRVESETEIGWIRTAVLEKLITKEQFSEQPEQELTDQPTEDIPQEESMPQQDVSVQQPEEVKNDSKEEQPEPKEPEVKTLDKIGYVKTEGLRVRKGPSTDTEEITSLSQNDEVKIIGQTGNWYKIKLDNQEGYVSAKYISDTKVTETTSRDGSLIRNEVGIEQQSEVKEVPVVEEAPQIKEPVQEATPSTSGTTGNAIVEYAKQYLGYKYVSGGSSPSKGFDCSGFTQYVYKHFGISINRTSGAQINNGVAVSKENLQPGDLVIFNNDANTRIGHVGIYVGGGNFIHASNPKGGVKITTLESGYYHQRYVGARRVI